MYKWKSTLLFIFILLLALGLRLYGLNFDQSHHLHPDERFLTMVSTEIKIPPSLYNYFSQKESVLNPYNYKFNFYVYGTFPLLITRFFAELFKMTDYDHIFLVGRYLSAIFDVCTLIIVYFLSLRMFSFNKLIALLAAFFYAIAVFPIQQAHFFTVDSFTVFFSTLTVFLFYFFLEIKKKYLLMLTGISFGLTLASKISIVITLPLFVSALILLKFPKVKDFNNILKFIINIIESLSLFLITTGVSFRIFQPYAYNGLFTIFPNFIQNISEASKMITGEYDYPPNIQWVYTSPIIWPLKNIFYWGLGPIICLFAISGIIIFLLTKNDKSKVKSLFILFFMAIIFLYQGIQLAKYMRYFYPLYPYLTIFAGFTVFKLINVLKNKIKIFVLIVIIVLSIYWPLSFMAIYSRPHSRVMASEWIYQHIPTNSTITSEEWDDGLPLGIPGYTGSYNNIGLGIYNTDLKEKWNLIADKLSDVDYIILSSNRLFGSIPRYPLRYPVASRYYPLLFQGKLGFEQVAKITSFPSLGLNLFKSYFPILTIDDHDSEESFTVYDHPQIYIFKKTTYSKEKFLTALELERINLLKEENPAETNFFYRFLKRK